MKSGTGYISNIFSGLILISCLMLSNNTYGQPVGNEWIDFNQTYFKITVAETGFYKLTYNDLLNAGFPVQTVDPRRIQLFFRGMEQSIEITGQLDARFDPQDHIIFYGQRNDGTLDKHLYVSETAQPHAYYNLSSDSTAYFLTWRLDTQNGKRVSTFFENNVANIPPENYYLKDYLILQTSNYSAGRTYPEGTDGFAQITEFDFGEGWTGSRIGINQNADFTIKSISDLFVSDQKPILETLLSGRNNRRHKVEIFAGSSVTALRSLGEIEFDFYNTIKFSSPLEWTDIAANGDLHVRARVKGYNDGIPDFASVSYVKATVPHQWKITTDTLHIMSLKPNPGGKSYLRINNSLAAFSIYDVTDPYQLVKIGYNHSVGITTAMVDNTTLSRKLAIHNNKYLNTLIKKIEFVKINPADHDYLIISHRELMKPSGNLSNPVKAYADYRASTAGGSLKPLIADIDQLYDQFCYGEKSPLAIRHYCDFMIRSGHPQFLFLIGKGLDITHNYHRQNQETYLHKSLLPPAGYPASDINFTTGLGNSIYEPAIPTGRLSAKKPGDVEIYLNKIKEMESQPFDALWRKELIHLSGGLTASELNLFNRYMVDFKNIAEGDYLGGKAAIVSKKTNFSTELINISEEVNNGKTMITFFGHSGSTATDLDIGYVSDDGFGYRNKGKYPVFLINGCNAGHIFSASVSFGEDWMLTPNRGAIGFLASVSLGYPSYLKRYSDYFYSVAFADSLYLNKSIGEVQKEASKRYMANILPTPLHITHVQQMILQGDPYYKMFPPEKPDFAITNADVLLKTFNGDKVTALTDSFAIGAIVRNFGRTVNEPLQITIERLSENGSFKIYEAQNYEPVKYLDTLWFTIHKEDFDGFGKNYFTIHLDYYNLINELDENNNTATFSYFIPLNSPRNILPTNFAIVNNRNLELVAQTSDLLGENRDYIIELDTSSSFNSLYKKQWTLNDKVLVKKQVELLDIDSTVYFWRTRFALPLPEEDDGWSVSSFTFIDNSPEGWAQIKFAQIRQNSINGLVQNGGTSAFKFQETENEIFLRTFGPNHPEHNYEDVELFINGLSYIFSSRFCTNNSINLVAFDKTTTIPYLGIYFGGYNELDRRSCGRLPQLVNNFLNHEIENPSADYLTRYIDSIPEGDHILLFSIGNVTFQNWPEAVKNKLNEIGVSAGLFASLQNGYPIIILGRKGSVSGTAIEILPDLGAPIPPLQQELEFQHALKGKYSEGSIVASTIGPATAWNKIYTKAIFSGNPSNDEYSFDIIGIKANGAETILHKEVEDSQIDISDLLANEYPYLKLKYRVRDELDFTPAQLKQWLVLYDPAPEGILLMADGENPPPHKKQEGEDITMNFIFENISKRDFQDSIPVHFSNYNISLRNTTESAIKIPAVKAGVRQPILLEISTLNKIGKNNLGVDVNPRILPEQHYFNNFMAIDNYLEVEKDDTNPILDVLVDGRYIMDGDIISPTPLILVRVKDENKFLFKSDTANVDILLKQDCDECTFKRINFTQPQVKWTPASSKEDFQVEYQPEKLENGRYILQVQATDASGNPSGSNPYRVRFEVVNETAITNFYPYPNPFSTSTRFVFTLTGAEIPDKIKIQIMTISGKIVREISQDELGVIRIGHNITSYAWDGKDGYGDQLANGVYLYKVEVQKDGKRMEQRETSGDRAFRKGYGKIYLLR